MRILMKTISKILLLVFAVTGVVFAQVVRNPEITVEELKHHVRTVSSDELEGRRAGSPGADVVAKYLADELAASKVAPGGVDGSYYQEFEFVAGVELGKKNSVQMVLAGKATSLTLNTDVRPLGFSDSGAYEGPVVFVGYGISAAEKEYDDYAGIDVKDKAVLLFRFHPDGGNPHSEFGQYASMRYKAVKARENGAKAIILVTGPADTDKDGLMKLSYDQSVGNSGIIAVNLTQKAADHLLCFHERPIGCTF